MKDWIIHLRTSGVYFNEPLDLDMSMFTAFRDEYKQLSPGARGPKGEADEACRAVLGSNGNPEPCSDLQNDDYL